MQPPCRLYYPCCACISREGVVGGPAGRVGHTIAGQALARPRAHLYYQPVHQLPDHVRHQRVQHERAPGRLRQGWQLSVSARSPLRSVVVVAAALQRVHAERAARQALPRVPQLLQRRCDAARLCQVAVRIERQAWQQVDEHAAGHGSGTRGPELPLPIMA